MSRNEEGSFLVEVLFAAAILLMIAATSVSQLTSLTRIKVQSETRDRGIILANGLQENMQAAGCGFDVSNVNNSGVAASNELETQKPWARVFTCAFSALAASPALTDDDGNYTGDQNAADATALCGGSRCEMGDQEFERKVTLNESGTKVTFKIVVSYWFEKTGSTSSNDQCATLSSVKQPDVIVRKVNVSWPNVTKTNSREDLTVVKRQNIPADTVEFSSSSRVGGYSEADRVVMSGNVSTVNIQVTRLKKTTVSIGTTVKGGANCVWFPYINKDAIPAFSVNGAPSTASIASFPPLENRSL